MRVLILLALLGAALAVPRPPHRIIGGSPTTVEQYPFMANMQLCIMGLCEQSCGGSLLTSRIVLSAAHCYYVGVPVRWRVLLGTTFASSGGSAHEVSRIKFHEDYDNVFFYNDIALVHLATPAVFSDSVKIARIPGPNYNLADGTALTALGWGLTDDFEELPEELHHVDINIINQELCAERYAYLKTLPGQELTPNVTSGMICAGILDIGGKDACFGDSGGPLAHARDIIIGIVSWGLGCADDVYPGVFTRVSSYTRWILDNSN